MVAGHRYQTLFTNEGVIEVHCAATGQQENVLSAGIGQSAHQIVSDAHVQSQ
jgi:hypothetical protein